MKLRVFSWTMLVGGISLLIFGVVLPSIVLQNYAAQNGAIGIIGGAETPTAVFITFSLMNGWPFCATLFGVILIISALFCLIFTKTVKNNCNIKTTALSLGISAVGAVGLVCVFCWFIIVSFGKMSQYPIEYPVSVMLGILSFFVFIVLIALYLKLRKINWSIKGIIIDVLTSIVYLPIFFFVFSYLYQMLD